MLFCLYHVWCKAYETNEKCKTVQKNRTGHGGNHAEILSDVERRGGEEMLHEQVKCLVNSGSLADIKNYAFFISRAP